MKWLMTAAMALGLCVALGNMAPSRATVTWGSGCSGNKGGAHMASVAYIPYTPATCTEAGQNAAYRCEMCGDATYGGSTIAALGHNSSISVAAIPATCTSTGKTAGTCCSRCGIVTSGQTTTNALGHSYAAYQPAVEATCQPGKTATQKCSRCGDIIGGEYVAPVKDHTPVIDPAVEATCTTNGCTEGSHCSACGTVIVQQEQIIGQHSYVAINATQQECSVCGSITAIAHTHEYHEVETKATCTDDGMIQHICEICGYVRHDVIELSATGHTEETIPGKAATATSTGLTEGKRCSVCGAILEAQTVIPATGGSSSGGASGGDSGSSGGSGSSGSSGSSGTSGGVAADPGASGEDLGDEALEDEDTPLAAKPFLFTDVAAGKWYYTPINYVYQNSIMAGTGETTFEPNTLTSRAMLVTLLYNVADGEMINEDVPLAAEPMTFGDVASGKWYSLPVAWAASNRIVGGYTDGNFGPNDNVTREQMVVILHLYAQKMGYDVSAQDDLSRFVDVDRIHAYAVPAMKWAVGAGIINGKEGNQLDPRGYATRAEIATVMMLFFQKVAK